MLYVYCIVPFEREKGNFVFNYGQKRVYVLPYKDIAAVIADCEKMECEVSENAVKEHEEIMRKVMAEHTVIPVAFGMTFKSKEILQGILEESYAILKEYLLALRGKIEVGIKIISTENAGKENLSSIIEDIENSLSAKSIEAAKGRLFSDRLLLNTSFLIEKDKLEEFSAAVVKLEEKYPQFKFLYSGPWAPYSFVNIEIHAR